MWLCGWARLDGACGQAGQGCGELETALAALVARADGPKGLTWRLELWAERGEPWCLAGW